ncbi:outer membrane beta-barrel protein [Legionella anisa]|uniref:Porin family protein n=1 Tax=Legionella anisa TaxID=28082 RepID=A0AAX0WZP4_9GAMM|nr:outer membrane beta-barrel protein [Legionella anisa]AWN73701.1 porin family protein [Legionella anisa]KTC70309.1 opacity protein-like surface antigen [Legionella anisa]MBN5936351.1 porin family protein [Legionella anisa]MCW8426594.1 outer membrane beta-barrel protein [Legionella anisa]MCW8448257.1 outer membrane beta-barrel protein [Legionella anisa]
MKFAFFSVTLLASGIAAAATPVNGWYSSAFGGYTHLNGNVSKNILGFQFDNVDYESGFNAGLRLGYQYNPMRYELEYTYLRANTQNFQVDFIDQIGVTGNTNANIGMANIYYDFPDVILPTISPFVGVGIGYAYIQTSLESTGPFGVTLFDDHQHAFAYQGTAGLTFNFAENWALNAAYRYLATASSGSFGRTLQAQMGSAGVVYRFDTCNYK